MKSVLAYIIFFLIVGGAIWFVNAEKSEVASNLYDFDKASPSATMTAQTESKINRHPNGLEVQDIVVGTGAEIKTGDVALVHYSGTLTNGTKFDSSYDRGQPFQFNVGAGDVIQGWDLGIPGMKIGGKRRLVIPASLAYGDRAVGSVIPANATLVFEVELVNFAPGR